MYQRIKTHKTVVDQYSKELISRNVVTEQEYKDERSKYDGVCKKAFEDTAHEEIKHSNWIDSPWPGEEQLRLEGEGHIKPPAPNSPPPRPFPE